MTGIFLNLWRRRVGRTALFAGVLQALLAGSAGVWAQGFPQAVRAGQEVNGAVDAGAIPSSQRISLTLTLKPGAAQTAALEQFLTDVTTASSPSFHHWMTPQQFGQAFGAGADQVAAATAWARSQNLSVDNVSASGTRVSVSGSAGQVETAFAVSLHHYQIGGAQFFANTAQPAVALPLFSAVEGLDNLPAGSVSAAYNDAQGMHSAAVSFASLAAIVDANATAVLTLDSTVCTSAVSAAQAAEFTALLRQANAQGMTVIADRGCSAGAFPAALAEVTAVSLGDDNAETVAGIALRPVWQAAAGLPADGLRSAPDLTAASLAEFAQAIATIASRSGGRLGNINSTLYALAPEDGVFTQPDSAAAGTWEGATGLGLVSLPALIKAWPLGQGANALSVTSSNYSPVHGQSFVLTATAASANGGSTPTGTVTFTSPQAGFTAATVTLNASGTATSAAWQLPGGSYAITGTYSGDASYTSTIATVNVTVQPEAAVFTVGAPSSVALGNTVTATVNLVSASGFGTPNASVTVTPSGITGGTAQTQTLTGTNGTAKGTYTFTTNQAASVQLQVNCTSNDQSFSCYTPQSATVTVPQATPTVTLTATPTSPAAGTTVKLSAAVTGLTGIAPTGSVQFFDGATALGTGSVPTATYSGTFTPGAAHVLTAVYQGDSNYVKATSNTVNTTVSPASTTTVVSASATTASYGQAITLNVSVTPSALVSGTLPTGTLTFTGAGTTTSSAVSGGSANVTLSNLPVGTYTIGTTYSGDTNYAGSTANTVTVTVTQSTATLNAALSSTSFTTGSTSTLTATVTLPGSAQVPAGTTFNASITGVSGASYKGTFAVNTGGNTGTGSVVIAAPPSGAYMLQVTCGTNANFTCAPASLSITSTAAAVTGATGTTTTLTINPVTPSAGTPVTLTATVTATAVTAAITGTVTFYDGTKLVGSGTVATVGTTSSATATATLTGTAAHSLTAVYSGDTNYATSTSTPVAVTAAAVPAGISLTSNVASTVAGYNVVLTATVSGNTSSGTAPTGTVSFYIAGPTARLLGTSTVGTAGSGLAIAVLSTSSIPDGTQTIYAVYNGDANFSSVISNNVTIGVSDYSVTFIPQSLTVSRGQSGQTTLILGIINGYAGAVVFGCTPPPNTLITCSFSPTVLIGGGTSTMTIFTTAPKTAALVPVKTPFEAIGGMSLAALIVGSLPGRRRRRVPALLIALLGVGLAMNLGCSGANSTLAVANGGTPLGTASVVINTAGTDGTNTVQHNYTYQVTVQ